jgi:hypothetical protein
MYMYDTHAETAGTMQTRGLDVIRRSTLTRCGLRREAGREQTVADSGTQHTTHNTATDGCACTWWRWRRQSPTVNRQPAAVDNNAAGHGWCLVLWWGVGTCRRERRDERVTCLSCVFGGEELEKGIAISYILANYC